MVVYLDRSLEMMMVHVKIAMPDARGTERMKINPFMRLTLTLGWMPPSIDRPLQTK